MSALPPSIAAAMAAAGGRVTFARFMELALTDPEAGYYTSRERILGPRGDFSTAPRLAPAFNRMTAHLLAAVVDAADKGPVLVAEVGPGQGELAAAVVGRWDAERPDLRDRVVVRLVDLTGALTQAQRAVVDLMASAGWDAAWAEGPPGLEGLCLGRSPGAVVVFSNELFDALPIHRVDVRIDRARECWVRVEDDVLVEEWGELSQVCAEELALLFGAADMEALRGCARDGRIELRPAVGEFLGGWARAFDEVCVVSVDYGEWRLGPAASAGPTSASPGQAGHPPACVEHPPTDPGPAGSPSPYPHEETVRGYAHHVRQSDLYRYPGRQDLTADVDFRAVAAHGGRHGLECLGYATLATVLGGLGGWEEAERLRASASSSLDDDMAFTVLRALLDPEGVGGLFKVMIQAG